MLASAWEQKSYRQIRNLAILCHSDSDSSLEPALRDVAKENLMFALTNRPYKGRAVDTLYYARFCSIVQSSGTGKTCTMIKLARKGVLVLYMNLRPVADKSGFPVRDDIPASILTKDGSSQTDCRNKCCAIFAAIFKLVCEHLSIRTSDGKAAVEDWNNEWDVRSSPRAGPFARLKSTYDEIKKDIDDAMVIDSTSGRPNSASDFAADWTDKQVDRDRALSTMIFLRSPSWRARQTMKPRRQCDQTSVTNVISCRKALQIWSHQAPRHQCRSLPRMNVTTDRP